MQILLPASALEASTSVPRTTSFWQLALTAEQSAAQVHIEQRHMYRWKLRCKNFLLLLCAGELDECSIIREEGLQVTVLLTLTNTPR